MSCRSCFWLRSDGALGGAAGSQSGACRVWPQAGRGCLVCWGRGERQPCPWTSLHHVGAARSTLRPGPVSGGRSWEGTLSAWHGPCLPCLCLGLMALGCSRLLLLWAPLSEFAPYLDLPATRCAVFWGTPPWDVLGLPTPWAQGLQVGWGLGGARFPLFHPLEGWLKGEGRPTPIMYNDCQGVNYSHFIQTGQCRRAIDGSRTVIIGTSGMCRLSEFEKSRVSIFPLIGPRQSQHCVSQADSVVIKHQVVRDDRGGGRRARQLTTALCHHPAAHAAVAAVPTAAP